MERVGSWGGCAVGAGFLHDFMAKMSFWEPRASDSLVLLFQGLDGDQPWVEWFSLMLLACQMKVLGSLGKP